MQPEFIKVRKAIMQIKEVLDAIRPHAIRGAVRESRTIEHLLTDSRLLPAGMDSESKQQADRTLFFAIETDKDSGARYIPELIQKGVRTFVLDARHESSQWSVVSDQCLFIYVQDVVRALQDLAAYKRSLYHCPVIGITGSNGKTVVKEWLYQLLKDDYRITRSPKSYNSQIGVPLSVWEMDERTTLGIFEAGISEPGEMRLLERIIRPTIGVLTYIGAEHGENFASLEEKRAEKMLLFAHCPVVVEDPMHQNVRTCAAVMRALGYEEDEINRRILAQTHETVMQVNLRAMVDNVRYFKGLLRPTTQLTCMVKAFAYGAGSVEVSRALQDSGLVDYLAVAVADEGCELRRAGITLPIIIMDPEVAALDLILENNLQPNIYSFQSLENILEAASAKGLEDYPIHIKIDSGMHRLGFYMEEIPALIERLRGQRAVRVQSVFSHLAGSDEPQFDDFTRQQIQYFDTCAETLKSGLRYPILKHICNSAGIERFADFQFDMCRLGIGLYGISFNGAALKTVCSLKTTILSLKTVKAGETIGYGRHTLLHEDRQIAVIPIGYADGFDRRFSNYGGSVIVRGMRCPVVGNVCMDQAMVDVTGADAQVGDEVEIFGERLSLNELAARLDTIPYEVLTSVSRRVKRVYFT
ncbi:MAG: alanine racemase [Paludibacteraceae bacterium]